MSKQKSYTKEFKFKVVIEMIKRDLTIAEIISKYQVPRSVLSKWKKQLLDNGPEIYKKVISQCRHIVMINYMQR